MAAGGDESVQRVITAVHGLSRRLNQWYDRQLADLDISAGEWAVMSTLVRDGGGKGCTPSELADAANVAPSSMTHRLDRMTERGLVTRATDPENRVRVRVSLSDEGWELFRSAIRESDMVESDVLEPLSRQERADLAELLERAISASTVDGSRSAGSERADGSGQVVRPDDFRADIWRLRLTTDSTLTPHHLATVSALITSAAAASAAAVPPEHRRCPTPCRSLRLINRMSFGFSPAHVPAARERRRSAGLVRRSARPGLDPRRKAARSTPGGRTGCAAPTRSGTTVFAGSKGRPGTTPSTWPTGR